MAKLDWKSLLCAVLDCGCLDLRMLEDSDEDFVLETVYELRDEYRTCKDARIDLNSILEHMFYRVKNELMEAWEVRMEMLEDDEGNLTIDEREELADMRKLNPDEDITWFINWSDSHIYINEEVEAIYRNWFDALIGNLEAKMGLDFE